MVGVMKKIICSLLILILGVMSVSCGGEKQNDIHISGSRTVAYIMTEIAEAFEKDYPQYNVIIEGIGSRAGVADTGMNENHIGMSSRSITIEERDDVEPFLLCKDAIVLIVNKNSTLDKITKDELAAIYLENRAVGDVTRAISRVEQSTTRVAFTEATGIGGEKTPLHEEVLIVDSISTMKNFILDDQTKLGYMSLALIDDEMKVLEYSDGGDYFAPTIENIQRDRYSIYRPFYLVVPKSLLKGSTQIFLDFCRSDKAKEIILKNGLVPVN